MNGQKGFTLVESLIVLAVFMIISTVTVFSLKPQNSTIQIQAFLTQLKTDLYYAQNYALTHNQDVSVVITPSKYRYIVYVYSANQEKIIQRNYDTSFYFIPGSLPLNFTYQANGNVNKFGTFFIKAKKKTYQITFLIGRGRFYFVEK
ncbi:MULTISPECIES: competence type IV pilus minor pilin ComGD [Bacillaceae]|uniref:competence type IV pilus minor pilin ComGD n=1 Tax=Bacillaceae TaxID=186817 RepID=UPI00300096CA